MPDKNSPVCYVGDDAITKFREFMLRSIEEDASGRCYVVIRGEQTELQMFSLTGCGVEGKINSLEYTTGIERLNRYEMIVVDSGNSSGDSWIATFFPLQRVLTFVDQNLVSVSPLKAISA